MARSNNVTKSMWQIVRDTTNKNRSRAKPKLTMKIHSKLTSNPKEIANALNDYFASVGKTVSPSAGAGASQPKPLGRSVHAPRENSMYLRLVEPREMYDIIRSLKNKNSCGIDEVPPSLLRKCAKELTLPFYLLVNQSFTDGVFPDLLKKSIIKPIHKKGEKTDPQNYRPIALLPAASKIFETAMCRQLNSFCEKFSIFDDSQHGFRMNRSTTLAVFKYIHEVCNMLNDKKRPVGVMLDMSKAYDRVQYDILLKKIYGIGIRGPPYIWFKSYLENREQYVDIEHYDKKNKIITNIRSDVTKMTHSIPQGSILGCILFLIYINDLPKTFKEFCILFADDISLIFSFSNDLDFFNTLTKRLNDISNWMTDHNLKLNFEKTKLIEFRPHQRKKLNINFTYNNIDIECVEDLTFLGIEIDSNLNWKSHIEKLKLKLSKFIYGLRQLKQTSDLKTALTAYYAYSYSLIKYGIILWGNSTNINEIFILQKKCIRILVHIKKTESCRPHFKNLKILTLPCIYILEMSKFVRKNIYLYKKKEYKSRRNHTKHLNKLTLPISNLAVCTSSSYTMSEKVFNNLPDEIRNTTKENKFIKLLKDYLITKCFYTLQEFFDENNK